MPTRTIFGATMTNKAPHHIVHNHSKKIFKTDANGNLLWTPMEICNEWSNELKTYRLIQSRLANSSTRINNKIWGYIIESICIFLNVDEDWSRTSLIRFVRCEQGSLTATTNTHHRFILFLFKERFMYPAELLQYKKNQKRLGYHGNVFVKYMDRDGKKYWRCQYWMKRCGARLVSRSIDGCEMADKSSDEIIHSHNDNSWKYWAQRIRSGCVPHNLKNKIM